MEEIIRTKLYIPGSRENWVARPRLLARLDESFNHTLSLLVAPAGYGKTTLLSDWIHSRQDGEKRAKGSSPNRPLNAAWITLDERDNDLARFMTYLVAALETLEIHIDEPFLQGGRVQQDRIEATLGALINRIADTPEVFFVVLDDFQAITALPVYEAVSFLIHHLPPQMHLVLACRTEPALPLGQLRARGQLLELRASELRFTSQEARAFLTDTMELDLPDEAFSALEARTEGWIAGLQLAALSMRGRKDVMDFIQTFTGGHRYIVDYLADQVLHQLPEALQVFLLESSILGQMSRANCEAILGEPGIQVQDALEYIEKANLFLEPLDDDREWYRYHPLFADFLRDRLRRSKPERWSELHRRASEWCEQNGWIAEAVDHALAIGDTKQAAGLVEQIVEAIWMKGEMARLWGWLQALPDELIRTRPRLCIFHAWISNIKGEGEVRDARLREVAESLERGGLSGKEREMVLGMQAALQSIIAIMNGDVVTTLDRCRKALEHLPEENFVWRCLIYRNLGNAYLLEDEPLAAHRAFQEAYETSRQAGNIYMALISMYELGELDIQLGKLSQAASIFRSALQLAEERGAPGLTITGALHTGLSEVLRQWNRLEEGIEHARAGIELGLLDGSIGVQLCGYTRLADLFQGNGNFIEASQALRKAMALAPSMRQTAFIAHMEVQSRLWWLQGDLEATQRWLEMSGIHPHGQFSCRDEAGYLTLARLLIHQGDLAKAGDLLARLRDAAGQASRRGRLIEILAIEALVYDAQGNHKAAMDALEEALILAEPEGHLRVFLDEGEPMRSLIQEYRMGMKIPAGHGTQRSKRNLGTYLEKLLGTFSKDSDSQGYRQVEEPTGELLPVEKDLMDPLSGRELEILRLIAAGLSNQEIARELVVATSTVHWHTKNIYSKLNVHSRTQATRQARQLGLVS
jgi:LuxR family maltose regulon positive regulatory protein